MITLLSPSGPKNWLPRLHALRRRTFQFTPESFYIFGDLVVDFNESGSGSRPRADSARHDS